LFLSNDVCTKVVTTSVGETKIVETKFKIYFFQNYQKAPLVTFESSVAQNDGGFRRGVGPDFFFVLKKINVIFSTATIH
jgi:hypothetical protein